MALSPDGRALVVGDEHGTVTFVDPVTRRALHAPYRPQSSYVRQIVFSPDGSRLAVGGVGMIQLLNGRTFEPLSYLRLPPGDLQYFNVAFSPDGRVLIGMYLRPAGLPEEPSVKAVLLRFDGRSGRRLGRAASIASAGPLADAVGFDPGGRWIVTVARAMAVLPGESARTVVHGNGVVLRDPRTLRPLRSFPGVAVAGALSPDGATFALGGDDGTVRFLDLRTGTLRTASGRHQAAVRGLRFTSDGRSLVSVGDDARTIVWDVDAAAAAETLEGHAGPVVGLAIDPKGRTAYTTGFDGTLITWDLAGDRRLGRPFEAATTSGDRLVAMAISRDGRTLAVRQADGSLALTDLATLTRRRLRLHGVPLRRSTPYAPAFGPDGTLAISGADGLLALLDTRTGRIVSRLRGHRDIVFTPATSANGRTVASTGEDGTLRLWDAVAAQPLGSPISLGGSPAGGAAITPDGSEVAVPLDAGTVEVFDVRSQRRLASLRVDDSWPTVTRFSADGRLLLTGTEAGRVRVYTVRNPRPLGPAFATVAGTVSSVDASPDDQTLVTAGIDGRIRLWDVASRQPIGTPLPGAANVNAVAAFTPDGDHVVAVFATGRGYRWDVRPSAWERQACAIAGRRLTRAEWHAALPGRDYAPAC